MLVRQGMYPCLQVRSSTFSRCMVPHLKPLVQRIGLLWRSHPSSVYSFVPVRIPFTRCIPRKKQGGLSTMKEKQKIVIIIGTTGVGKTKLGIELAQQFDGEVISADSMQVYKSLDIGSGKVTPEEAQNIPHHLIDIKELHERYDVKMFRKDAGMAIDDILSRNKLPIVVGGTFYYVESLLWDNLAAKLEIADTEATPTNQDTSRSSACPSDKDPVNVDTSNMIPLPPIASIPHDKLHSYLELVDPVMGNKLHHNDIRKITRSLEVYQTTGKRHSDLIRESGGLRGKNNELQYDCVVIWLDAASDVLAARQQSRVDQMVERGLVDEVKHIYTTLEKHKVQSRSSSSSTETETETETDPAAAGEEQHLQYEYGACQSIGYKELLPVVWKQLGIEPTDQLAALAPEYSSQSLAELECEAIAKVKRVTVKYAKKQLKWIRRRLLGSNGAGLPVFRFDTSDLGTWTPNVFSPVSNVVELFLKKNTIPNSDDYAPYSRNLEPFDLADPHKPSPAKEEAKDISIESIVRGQHTLEKEVELNNLDNWQKTRCEVCDRVINGKKEYEIHIKSRRHKRAIAKKNKAKKAEHYKKLKLQHQSP